MLTTQTLSPSRFNIISHSSYTCIQDLFWVASYERMRVIALPPRCLSEKRTVTKKWCQKTIPKFRIALVLGKESPPSFHYGSQEEITPRDLEGNLDKELGLCLCSWQIKFSFGPPFFLLPFCLVRPMPFTTRCAWVTGTMRQLLKGASW